MAALALWIAWGQGTVRAAEIWTDPGLRARIRAEVQHAERRIQLIMFKLSDRGVTADLAHRASRGVAVQVILCPSQANNLKSARILRQAGAQVRWYPLTRPKQIMHLKAALIDESLLFGSANWTYWGLTRHHEGIVRIREQKLLADWERRFSEDWDRSVEDVPRVP